MATYKLQLGIDWNGEPNEHDKLPLNVGFATPGNQSEKQVVSSNFKVGDLLIFSVYDLTSPEGQTDKIDHLVISSKAAIENQSKASPFPNGTI